jgi:two-component system sensor histidine kinase TctE
MRDISLVVALPDEKIALRYDRLLFESALRNLIDNAIKYSFADSQIEIVLCQRGQSAVVTVQDRGRGLGEDASIRLAGRFQRGENVKDIIGSGLGLTIVRDVARAIGGSFTIKNRTGGGTCAELILPLG